MSNDNLALLAAAAYGEFDKVNNNNDIQKNLTQKVKMSDIQAKKFTDTQAPASVSLVEFITSGMLAIAIRENPIPSVKSNSQHLLF